MAKTKEELNTLKNEYKTVTNKLKELNDEELGYVTGGELKSVDPERTTCIWGVEFSEYLPIDVNIPQKCGNCTLFYNGVCRGGRG